MKLLVCIPLLMTSIPSFGSPSCTLKNALSAWSDGEVETAYDCARILNRNPGSTILLIATNFAKGHYHKAVNLFTKLTAPSDKIKAAPAVVQAYIHLHRFKDALAFAKAEGVGDDDFKAGLKILADNPPLYSLNQLDVIDFKNDPMTPTMPLFDAEINGQAVTSGLDTGASFIAMDPKLADSLGIKYTFIGYGNANDKSTKLWLGTADFKVGKTLVKNAPIYVIESLQGSPVDGKAIVGTSILENFLVTLDYPRRQMILSPKTDSQLRRQHFAMLKKASHTVPFYLWSDHYMFARGSIGSVKKLNFFVDTGLLAFDGNHRQIAFYGPTQTLRDLGYDEKDLAEPVLELARPLSLGALSQTGHLALHTDHFPVQSLGGVKIHGLISHAFLSKYVWTIDFKRREYYFAE